MMTRPRTILGLTILFMILWYGQIHSLDAKVNSQTDRQNRAANHLVLAIKTLLRGSRYVGTKYGIRNYAKPGGYSTARREFESIDYPYIAKDGKTMKGIVGEKWFLLKKKNEMTDPSPGSYYISISPISNPYKVEKRIWYTDPKLFLVKD